MKERRLKGKKLRGVKRSQGILGGIFSDSIGYIKESRNYIYFIIVVFLIGGLIGFSFPDQFGFFDVIIRDLSERVETLGPIELTWFIFQNNLSSAFFGAIAGVIFGIIPVLVSLINGALVGYVYELASSEGGFGVILYLIPHGIFELPAVFISLGLGVKFGMFVFAGESRKVHEFKRRFWNFLKVFFTVVLPLLVIAAIIEGVLIFSGT